MAIESKKRNYGGDKKPRASDRDNADAGPSTSSAPRPAPSFVSSLQKEEGDFPRGGGTSLTAFEVKQVRDEGRREADAEAAQERPSKKPKRGMSDREAKRAKKNIVKPQHEHDKDQIRVEHLNYKRLVPGSRVLTRVHTVLPLHLILSLPNNLLAHVPITEVSSTFTKLLSAEEAQSDGDDEEEDEDESAPELAQLFVPGQYFPAQVVNVFPTASQNFVSQYPMTETTRLAARVEMTLVPEKVNHEVAKADLSKGFVLVGEVIEHEDKGWRVGLGLEDGAQGWLATADVQTSLLPGQLVRVVVTGTTAGGRIIQLSLDKETILKAQLNEVSNVSSILPGQQVSALVTAIMPNGLNVKLCGFFDGTIDLAHLALAGEDIEEKYKVGKKVKARILYDNPSVTPRRFGLSLLQHVVDLTSPLANGKPIEAAIPIGKVLNAVTVKRVIQEWGLIARTDDGLEGFVHISHISDDRVMSLSSALGPYETGTLHRARVIGHSPMDGVLLLSFEQKVLDQVFMTVDELSIGQVIKGTIRRLTEKALFVNIAGSVDGAVWPLHYADIQLKNPEKRFKVGSSVKARVFELDAAKSRVVLTLKKTLVESTLDIPATFEDVKQGQVVPVVVSKLLGKGCIVDLFGGMRAFIPQSEASTSFTEDISKVVHVGKPINVRIIEKTNGKLVASVRQATATALAAEKLSVGDSVKGQISQVHSEQVVVTLVPSQATALLSLSTLANHRHVGINEIRASIKIGESLDDLVVVSKNPTTGLFIVGTKKTGIVSSGISKQAVSFDSVAVGQTVKGKVVAHLGQIALVALSPNVKGKLHPCDVSDDFSTVTFAPDGGVHNVDDKVEAFIVKSNPHTRSIELSTRASRLGEGKVVDAEIAQVADLKVGQEYRGFVKNIAGHGVFVSLGRNVTARVMIKELFDDFVKDWQSHFKPTQLVSGKILSINTTTGQVEMTLRKNSNSNSKGKEAKLGLADFSEGQKVVGLVRKVEPYGMFLRIDGSDVSGLCHKSEIADSKKADVAKALQGFRVGDQVKAKILSIDRETNKVALGIKASYFVEKEEEESGEEGEDEGGQEEDEVDEDDEEEESEDGVLQLEDSDDEEDEDADGDADSDEDEEDDDEDEDEADEEESESDEEVAIELAPTSVQPKKAKTAAPAAALDIGGFEWSAAQAQESDSESEDDAPAEAAPTKAKGKDRAVNLTAGAEESQPESASDFERALLASPNSSFLWIQYMSFLLQLHEIDQARKIGRQALERISYREEEEKLNVWMALVNLELGFGTQDEADKVFKDAQQYNDARTVLTRYAEALQQADKLERAEEVFARLAKRYSGHVDSWTRFAEFYLKKEDKASARGLLSRATKSLPANQHLELIQRMAILENKYGDVERCKTLFEGLVDRHSKKIDLWAVYIDQIAKAHDIQGVRSLFDRALDRKLTSKKAKFLFKKWLAIEQRIGDLAGQEKAKSRAREWVAKSAAAADVDESD